MNGRGWEGIGATSNPDFYPDWNEFPPWSDDDRFQITEQGRRFLDETQRPD